MSSKLFKDSTRLLMLLLCAEVVVVALHLATQLPTTGAHGPIFFDINIDRGLGESLRYMEELWIAALFIILARRTGDYMFVFWTVPFMLFFLDDSLAVHEVMGYGAYFKLHLAEYGIGPAWAQVSGEIVVFLIAGVLFVSTVLLLMRFGSDEFVRVSRAVLGFIALIGLFAIGVDVARNAVSSGTAQAILAVVEGGGELTGITLTLWYVFRHTAGSEHIAHGEEPRCR